MEGHVYYLNEPVPVILVIYDAKRDQAWWSHLNESLRKEGRAKFLTATFTMRVPLANVLDVGAVRRFRVFRDLALAKEGK